MQIDGNDSLWNDSLISTLNLPDNDKHHSEDIFTIPVIYNFRPPKHDLPHRTTVLKTIRRNNKVLNAAVLPKVACYNMRSLIPKVGMLATDMIDRMCSLALLTEVWEKANSKKHQHKIEELYEMKGLRYISTPRSGQKRGGGAAIVVDIENFSIMKLPVHIPKNLEIVWGLLKPKFICGKITKKHCG